MPSVITAADFPKVQWTGKCSRENGTHHPTKFAVHQFNCFDGEGITINGKHQYVYLAAYDGQQYFEVCNPKGLGSEQCFKFLVSVAARNPLGINVIFGGTYDADMMLRDVAVPALIDLQNKGTCKWRNWRIRRINRKEFSVIHTTSKKACTLWDTIGFFQSGFQHAIKQWLDVVDPTIAKGKASRQDFNLAELPFIVKYCKKELIYFEALMQRLWETLNTVGIKLSRWDGAGAAAQAVLQKKRMLRFKGTEADNEKHYYQARCAYAGGRFELVRPGDYRQPIYNYDINSAYPYAMTQLPPFTGLRECSKTDCQYTQYDLLKIDYQGEEDWELAPFHPYFFRSSAFNIYYPVACVGWHWGIEWIMSGKQGEVIEHLHWDDTGERPFSWISDYYQYRHDLIAVQDKAEKAVKLVINSLYGKLAQQRGWRPETDKKPAFHQLYWAGWITAYTRSMIYQAMMQHKDAVIAVETDGLFTTQECKLALGKGLGEWGLKVYQDITYVQSGMYFGTKEDGEPITRYRGLDPGQLTREMVLQAWESGTTSIKAESTRFRTLGTSLKGSRLNHWRQWITDIKEVNLMPQGKRRLYDPGLIIANSRTLPRERAKRGLPPILPLQWGEGRSHLTMPVSGRAGDSTPYNVLWADMADKLDFWHELDIDEERYIHEA